MDVCWYNNYMGSKIQKYGTPAIALVLFNSRYLFGNDL